MIQSTPPDSGSDAGKSLVHIEDISGLSKPAIVLIERVSDALGGYCRPWQIKRVAEAEAEADIIRAHANVDILQIEQRALVRMAAEETKRQENIESITAQAARQLGDDAKPEDMDADWIANFFERCRIVSDREMQSLWARLLAGEATTSGTFAKRTVNFVSELDKNDAELFTNLCQFGWSIDTFSPLVFDRTDEIYKKNGIDFGVLRHLADIGLVTHTGVGGYSRTGLEKHQPVAYYGKRIVLTFSQDSDNEIEVGEILLTKTGLELAAICGSGGSEEFFQYVLEKWIKEDLAPRCPFPQEI